MEQRNSFIITDDLRINALPPNCEITTKTIAAEAVKILFSSSTKNQVNFRFPDCEKIFRETVGEDYNNDNYPRKFQRGDTVISVSYCKPKRTEENNSEPFLLYRLILVS